jgi:hypothetical protein
MLGLENELALRRKTERTDKKTMKIFPLIKGTNL